MAADIAIRDEPGEGRFLAELDGSAASAWYDRDGDTLRFVRVDVPIDLLGRGVLNQLIRVALVEARTHGLFVEPSCTPFLDYMRDHPETHDLLSEAGRRLLST